MSGLPKGWTFAQVGDIAVDISYGFTAKSSTSGTGPRYLRITDIQNGSVCWDSVPFCRIPSNKEVGDYKLKRGDILFARTGATTGKSFLIKTCPDAIFASYLIRVRTTPAVLPEFLSTFFQSQYYWNQITENTSGSAQPNCNASKLASLNVPIPPLSEQYRIAAKLGSPLMRVHTSQQRLENVPKILKRFRQAVLAAACSGALTTDWRQQHCFPNADQSNKPSDAPDVPSSWSWACLGQVSAVRGGVTKGRKLNGKHTITLPYLRVANVQDGFLDLSEIKEIEALPEDEQKYALVPGDILFTEGGDRDKLGRGTVWNGQISRCIHQNHIFRARLEKPGILASYVSLASKSDFSRRYFFENASQTVNLASINLTALSGLPLAIPPLKEQEEIQRRVKQLFELADRLEARVKKAIEQLDKLTQSTLAKAFRGELVPTEADLAAAEGRDFESAEQLLARIQRRKDTSTDGAEPKTRKRAAAAAARRG